MAPRIPSRHIVTLRTCGWTVADTQQVAWRSDYSNRAHAKCSRTINGAGDWALRHANGGIIARGSDNNAVEAALSAGDALARWEHRELLEPEPWPPASPNAAEQDCKVSRQAKTR